MVLNAVPCHSTPTASNLIGHSEVAREVSGATEKFTGPHQVNRFSRNFTRYRHKLTFYASKSLTASRARKTLSGKSGANNIRPMGFRNHKRAETKFCEPTSSRTTATTNAPNQAILTAYKHRNSGDVVKRAITKVPLSGRPGVSEHPIFSPQKRRWAKTSCQPPTSTLIPPLRTLQNGGNPYAKRSFI